MSWLNDPDIVNVTAKIISQKTKPRYESNEVESLRVETRQGEIYDLTPEQVCPQFQGCYVGDWIVFKLRRR